MYHCISHLQYMYDIHNLMARPWPQTFHNIFHVNVLSHPSVIIMKNVLWNNLTLSSVDIIPSGSCSIKATMLDAICHEQYVKLMFGCDYCQHSAYGHLLYLLRTIHLICNTDSG